MLLFQYYHYFWSYQLFAKSLNPYYTTTAIYLTHKIQRHYDTRTKSNNTKKIKEVINQTEASCCFTIPYIYLSTPPPIILILHYSHYFRKHCSGQVLQVEHDNNYIIITILVFLQQHVVIATAAANHLLPIYFDFLHKNYWQPTAVIWKSHEAWFYNARGFNRPVHGHNISFQHC